MIILLRAGSTLFEGNSVRIQCCSETLYEIWLNVWTLIKCELLDGANKLLPTVLVYHSSNDRGSVLNQFKRLQFIFNDAVRR